MNYHKPIFIICILFSLQINTLFAQKVHSVGTVQELSITKDEVKREMKRYRFSVVDRTTGEISMQKLRKRAIEALIAIKVQEKLLRERNLWPFNSYEDFLAELKDANSQREIAVRNREMIYGPVGFSEETYFDYRLSNALIDLKHQLVSEKIIAITEKDMQEQFAKMQKTVYEKEKYTLEEYRRQVRDAFVEEAYAVFIDSSVRNISPSIDWEALSAINLQETVISSKEMSANSKNKKADEVITQTVYVSSKGGDDSNDGFSEESAWKTLQKVNSTTFGPGARILLKSGDVWIGDLHPKGSGSASKPIVIDRYGGDELKPLIDGNGIEGRGVVRLYNQQYWEISNLEIVNDAKLPGDRRGVEIKAANFGTVNHIHLKNLDIHHIKGLIGNGHREKRTAGIFITTEDDKRKPTRFNDILIEGCHIHHIQNQGIATSHEVSVFDYPGEGVWNDRKITNLIIRDNVIHHISKNAMIVRMTEGGLVERNLCYETATDITGNTIFSRTVMGTVFQYNEGFLNRSPDADGSLYDPDINSPGTIWQYSYSHDNSHGLVWFCTNERDDGIIVRYNLSENDKGSLVYFNYDFKGASVYNNVFYIGEHVSPVIIREKNYTDHTYQFYNNIIYNKSKSATYSLAKSGRGIQNRSYSNNLFYGIHPDGEPEDVEKITTDPLFVNPGKGINGLGGYKIKRNSPAIGTGRLISDNGGLDFFGNKVDPSAIPNRGIFNGEGQ